MQIDPMEKKAGGSGLDLGATYYVLFRHKWKIAISIGLGIVGAILVVGLIKVQYRSEAKVIIRYVLDTRSAGPVGSDAQIRSTDPRGDNIINSEIEILTSRDSIEQAVDRIGPDKILAKAGGGNNIKEAAGYLADRLKVAVSKKSDVVLVSLRHPDGNIARVALNEIVQEFLTKHRAVHGVGIKDEVLTAQMDNLRTELKRLEEDLRSKKKGQMVSEMVNVEVAKKSLNEEIVRIRLDISAAESELATKHAAIEFLRGISGLASDTNKVATPVQTQRAEDYSELLKDLSSWRERYRTLSNKYKEDSPQVKMAGARIQELLEKKRTLEVEDPQLTTLMFQKAAGNKSSVSPTETLAQIVGLRAQTNHLGEQLSSTLARLEQLEKTAPEIKELERKRDWVEVKYKWFSTKMEQASYEETMGSNYSNVQIVQSASPASFDFSALKTPLAAVLAGGLLLGLGMALFCEFVLDQSVRRPVELRNHLNPPLFVTIPDVSVRKRRLKEGLGDALVSPHRAKRQVIAEVRGIESNGVPTGLGSFFGALRDRTVMYLERMTHKPKLVAVTGCNARSGVTTIATGLARALSETAEGRVLFVDMTSESGASHPFLNGKSACGLSEMFDQSKTASVHENLYVATVAERPDGSLPIVPKRFASLIPKLKASDYDYVVFDMPPVTQTSITPRLAGLMDVVLLVVESERSQRHLVLRATEALMEAKANVRSVLNKHRTYVPQWLFEEQ